LDNILDLAASHLTNLNFVDLVLPSPDALNTFLGKCPKIKLNGEKTENYALGLVTFRTIGRHRSQPHPTPGPSGSRPTPGTSGSRPTPASKKSSNNPKRIKSEHDVPELRPQPDPGTSAIEVVNLTDSDEEGSSASSSPPPQVQPQPPTDPRFQGLLYNKGNKRGGGGRESPSLLG